MRMPSQWLCKALYHSFIVSVFAVVMTLVVNAGIVLQTHVTEGAQETEHSIQLAVMFLRKISPGQLY